MKKVLDRIKPSKKDREFVNKLVREVIKKIKIKDAKVILGGSGAKDTWLRDAYDVDLYVKFNLKYKDKDISKILGKALRKKFKIEKLYGSRDYYRIKKEEYTFEIIPILDIKNVKDALNITDVSPFHAKYVKKHKKGDEIRLTKQFCKAQNCYGAESYIRGFSGYLLECLVIHYNGFNNLIKNVAKWQSKVLIGDRKLINKLNKSKKQSPLIFIDPVDDNRNVAAALSKEKFDLFVKACKSYFKNKNEDFFVKKEFDVNSLKYKNLVVLDVKPLKGKEDIVGSKMLKCLNYIHKKLELNDFKVKKFGWDFDKKIFYFVFFDLEIDKIKKHYGPPLKEKERLKDFSKKWKKVYKEKGRVYANVRREFYKVEDFFEFLKKDENVLRLVKEIKLKN